MSRLIAILTGLFGSFRRIWTKPEKSSPSSTTTAASSNSGPSAQSALSVPNEDSGPQPVIASQDSAQPASSTDDAAEVEVQPEAVPYLSKGVVKVSISLASIGAAISAAVVAAEGITTEVAKVYTFASAAMSDAEVAYAKGTTKLASVLAAAQVVAADVGADWPTIQSDVTTLIANVKAAYNNALAATATTTGTDNTGSGTAS